jgi:hypothetical protein
MIGLRAWLAGWSSLLLAGWLAASLHVATQQDTLTELRRRFEQETDPVRKARAVERLGNMHLEQFRRNTREEAFDAALQALEEYRNIVRSAHESLKKSGRDADRNPAGFKQLEIHVRQSISKLDQAILTIPFDRREAFQEIRKELEAIDKELVEMLFPRRPGKK